MINSSRSRSTSDGNSPAGQRINAAMAGLQMPPARPRSAPSCRLGCAKPALVERGDADAAIPASSATGSTRRWPVNRLMMTTGSPAAADQDPEQI